MHDLKFRKILYCKNENGKKGKKRKNISIEIVMIKKRKVAR